MKQALWIFASMVIAAPVFCISPAFAFDYDAALESSSAYGSGSQFLSQSEHLALMVESDSYRILFEASSDVANANYQYELSLFLNGRTARMPPGGTAFSRNEGPIKAGEAAMWLIRAAKNGSAEANDALAAILNDELLSNEIGLSFSRQGALELYQIAFDGGYRTAGIYIGLINLEINAEHLLTDVIPNADENSDKDLQFEIGQFYRYEIGIPANVDPDYKSAIRWYTLAANQGHFQAMSELGIMYGGGVRQDLTLATALFFRAAANGNVEAIYRLGSYYEHGWGHIGQDEETAVIFYQKAAALGHEFALAEIEHRANVRQREITDAALMALGAALLEALVNNSGNYSASGNVDQYEANQRRAQEQLNLDMDIAMATVAHW